MKKIRYLSLITAVMLSGLMVLSGCSGNNTANNSDKTESSQGSTTATLNLDTSDMFTERDLDAEYDQSTAQSIVLSDSNSKVNITEAGVYILSGTVSDGTVTVDVPDTDKVQIVLNGVTITSKTSAAIYVKSADKVFVTSVKGTENTLSNGGTFTAVGSDNIDGVIFSKCDITFNGEGTLKIESPAGHSVVGKDDVKFTGGTYVLNCASHGVDANDSIRIKNTELNITAGKDGLHCENNDDSDKGYIYIESGTINITSDDDAIHATTTLIIDGGTFKIKAAEGLEATCIVINDGTISIEASDDGINAAKKSSGTTPKVEINGGKITIVMGQGDTDGIDSNGDIIINGGTVDVTGNSTFDYDGTGVINGGTVIVNGSEVTTLPNQMMGGAGGPGGMRGQAGDMFPNDTITSATPDADGFENRGTPPQMPEFDGSQDERPGRPDGNFGEKPSGEKNQKGKTDKSA